MENFQYSTTNTSSYPDSVNSSPRSRDIDPDNPSSWDDTLSSSNSNFKVKFMCSYGGRIRPRPHDNQLTYMGGDTKILSVDRGIKFATFISKLSAISDSPEVFFKYQLPGEDLDALISVTNDEDLEHMMLEYDRLYRSFAKPARLRLFIFPLNANAPSMSSFESDDSKSESQWFLDALNAAQANQNAKVPSPAPPVVVVEQPQPQPQPQPQGRIPDYLFGLDKGGNRAPPPPSKLQESPLPDTASNSPVVVGEPVLPAASAAADLHRQIHDLQRMQIASQEQEYYQQQQQQQQRQPHPQVALQQQAVDATAAYWQERQAQQFPAGMGGGGGAEGPPMYLIQTPAGVYQTPMMRQPVTGQVSQPYYGVQRMMTPEGYREQPVYSNQVQMVPPPVSSSIIQQQQQQQQQKPGGGGPYNHESGYGLVRPPVSEPGYAQVSFDNTGRQVYYAAPPGGVSLMQPPPYGGMQAVAAPPLVDGRQTGGVLNPEGKIVGKNPQA